MSAAESDARADIVATNTYDYRKLPAYRRAALAVTTGAFTRTLAHTIDSLIVPNAGRLHAQQSAQINRVGVASLAHGTATVLVFGQLTVHNSSAPAGRTDPFAAVVGLRRVGARWLLTRLVTDGSATCRPPGSADLAHACAAASEGAAALTTLRRASFERDFAHTSALLTGPLLTDFRSRKGATLHTMISHGFDLHSVVLASAVATATPDRVEVVVELNGFRSTSTTPSPQQLAVTVEHVRGRWLLSDVQSVAVS